ncbi:MAG TPA: carboxypeptidase-like regulatory domain-containing protein [Pyrinomonadaceae bacterium]|jgi:hypothetical protein
MSKQKFDVNKLRVAAPCSMSWEAMKGDDRKRLCDSCQLNVFNVAELTEPEVRALVAKSKQERVCVKLYRRADGTVITRDCPVGLRALRRRAAGFAGAALAAILSLFSVSYAQSKKDKEYKPNINTGIFKGETGFREGILKGTIIDPAGFAIPNVKITALNLDTGQKSVSTTNKKGHFQIALLSTGKYDVEIEAISGFSGYQRILSVNKNEAVQINVMLSLPIVGVIIDEEEKSNVDVRSSGTMHRITREMIERLPH